MINTRRRRRLTALERAILETLKEHQRCSYDELAARCDCDRSAALIAVRRLEMQHRIVKAERGRARIPNRYVVTDRLIQWNN